MPSDLINTRRFMDSIMRGLYYGLQSPVSGESIFARSLWISFSTENAFLLSTSNSVS